MDDRSASVVRTTAGKRGNERDEVLCLGVLVVGEVGALEPLWQQTGHLHVPSLSLMAFYCAIVSPEETFELLVCKLNI